MTAVETMELSFYEEDALYGAGEVMDFLTNVGGTAGLGMVLGAAAEYAIVGSVTGPWGALAGGLIGLGVGLYFYYR